MKRLIVLFILFLSISFGLSEDACSKQTGIITTSYHVYNAMMKTVATGDERPLKKYIGQTVYLTEAEYEKIVLDNPKPVLLGYIDRNDRRYVIAYLFDNTPEIIKTFQAACPATIIIYPQRQL